MNLNIYRGSLRSVIASTSAFEVNRTLMEVRKITCSMKSVVPIEWAPYNGGTYDFVMYNDEKYILYAKPTSEDRNEVSKLTYKLIFSGQEILLQNAPFLDVVTGTGSSIDEYRYTNGSIVNFFGDIRQFVLRLNANITYFNNHGGDLAGWTVELDLSPEYDYREFNVSSANSSLLDALSIINSAYSLKYYFNTIGANKKVIITDKVRNTIDYVFEQGEDKGLYNISATVSADKDVVTRLRPLGGSRNIPTDYKNHAKPIDNTRYCPNLMLPNDENGNIVYTIDSASGIQKYGVREKSVTQEFEGIYPSIRNVSLQDVYGTSSLPATGNDGVKLTGLTASQRVDQLIGASKVLNEQQSYFYVYLTDIGFYLDKTNEDGIYVYATTNEAVISMRTGLYTGVEFTIVKGKTKQLTGAVQEDPDMDIAQTADDVAMYNAGARYRVKLIRTEDNGAKFPSVNTSVPALSAGSEFVILNIFMPPVYVTMAENKLKQAAIEFLSIYDHSLYTIGLNIATGFTIEHPEIFLNQFLEGAKLKVKSNKIGVLNDSGGPVEINIQSVTISYSENTLFPTYNCTLAEIKKQTIFEQLSSEIRNVSASQTSLQSAGLSASAVSDILQRLQIIDNMFEWDKERTAIKAKYNFYGIGEITAYGYGTEIPWTTSLGNLTNVVNNADDVAGVDYILYKPKGASTWALKDASDIGGQGKIYYAGSGISLTDSNGDTANTINVRFGQGAGLVMEGSDSRVLTAINDIANIKKTTFWGQTMANNKVEGALVNTGNITPAATGVSDIGSPTLKYKNVYAELVGNADSATKLKTPRAIWGQQFDGTADILGEMSGVSIINKVIFFNGTNVGINHATPNVALHVSGTIKSTGEVVAYATNDYDPSKEFPKATKTSYGWVQIGDNINVVDGVISAAKQGIDETELAAYLTANNYLNSTNYTTYTVTKSGTGATGTWGISITGNAATASTATTAAKLAAARTLWGQSFDGSGNVSGAISNTGNITPSATNVSTVGTTALVYKAMYATSFVGTLLGNATSSSMWDSAIILTAGGDASGSTEIRGDANATLTLSVNKLHTARSLWGQSFDGTANVSGAISSTGHITPASTGVSDLGSTTHKYRNIYGNLVGNVSGNVNGTLTGNVTGNVSGSAGSLATIRTIWGQNFNGTQNVSGAMSGVSNINNIIYISGTNIGIGKSAPTATLDVTGGIQSSGTIKASGEVVAYATSDYDPSQDIPKASKTSYGWVKIGDNINVVDGVISAAKQGMDEVALAAYLSSNGYINSTNYTNYTVTKTGGGASGTWGINITGNSYYLKVHDLRNSDYTPEQYGGQAITAWFKNTSTPSSDWWSGISVAGWTTGYVRWQLAGPSSASIVDSLYFRTGIGSTWNAWQKVLTDTNYSSFIDGRYVLKAGDTMSGNLILNDSAATGSRMLKFTGYTDYAHIKFSAATSNDSSLEIATGDDGNTPIYIRQYNTSGAVVRTLTLLDEAGNTHIPSSINLVSTNTKLDQGDGYALRVNTYYGYMDVGPQNTSYAHFSTNIPRFHFNKPVYVQGDIYAGPYYSQKVWHEGNDGAGSGLDADLLDGLQSTAFVKKTGDTMTGTLRSSTIRSTLGPSDAYMNKCLYSYKINSASIQGIIKITLPFAWSFSMNVYRIVVYEYDQYAGSEILVSGYDYRNDKHFYQYGYSILGAYNKGVRLADDGSKICILLGTTSTVWRYPAVFLDTVYASYSGVIDNDWSTPNYNITLITSETGLSSITNLSDKMQDRYDARYVNVSGDTMSGSLTVNERIKCYYLTASNLELSYSTPYIDFHYDNSSTDYTSRIIESASGRLSISGKLAVGATVVNDSYALSATSFYSSGNLTVNGLSTFSGTITANGINCTSVNASAWHYSSGATGWYNSTYAGGIYMDNAEWVKVYNKKSFWSSGRIQCDTYFDRKIYAGASWANGPGAYNVAINNNSAQTPIIVAYRAGYSADVTGANRLFSFEFLNNGTIVNWFFGGAIRFEFHSSGNFKAKGNIVATGEVTAYSASDIRLKTHIRPISNPFKVLKRVRPVLFKWNKTAFELNAERPEGDVPGMIAQWEQSVLPVAIHSVYDKYLGIKYENYIPYLIAGANEHEIKIQQLQREIEELKRKVKELNSIYR